MRGGLWNRYRRCSMQHGLEFLLHEGYVFLYWKFCTAFNQVWRDSTFRYADVLIWTIDCASMHLGGMFQQRFHCPLLPSGEGLTFIISCFYLSEIFHLFGIISPLCSRLCWKGMTFPTSIESLTSFQLSTMTVIHRWMQHNRPICSIFPWRFCCQARWSLIFIFFLPCTLTSSDICTGWEQSCSIVPYRQLHNFGIALR